ncbi:hypothetical protein TWF694_008746 [Orbilia ellipsospora]|uniref:Uncharacterized protein n=1 Tax=Orbilia ellipsospora TaxID=2528407 RepID=A0AAV9XD84_9PEZI
MATPASPSASITEPASLTPRPADGRLGRAKEKKTSSLPSLEGQRFYPLGYPKPPENAHKKQKSRNHLVTWQEFVMDGFGPTMSLASLVSWQDMLSYSPPPHGADGTTTPPEIQNALEDKKKKNTREKLIKSIQAVGRTKSKVSSTRQLEDAGIDTPNSLKDQKKLWIVSLGKASAFGSGKKPKKLDDKKGRRLSLQPKGFGEWASRAKKVFSGKKRAKKHKEYAQSSSNARVDEYSSSESDSNSPTPHQRLLRRSDAPTKITVRKASRHQPKLPSLLSGPSSSTVSIGQPVVGWTFLAPPGQLPTSGSSSLQALSTSHFLPPSQLIQNDVVDRSQAPLSTDPLAHRHRYSVDDINHNEDEEEAISSKALLEPRMSVADSTKSHETLWRRSVSSPSIASSLTSLSAIQGLGSRHSSIWDYRGSVVSIPRDSVVSIKDVKHALRANLTGNLPHKQNERCKTLHKRISDKPTHSHVNGMFSSSGHVNPYHLQLASSDSLRNNVEKESTSRTATPTAGERRPSIVRKDHMEIYNHPYFEVAPGERHTSLSSVNIGNRSGCSQRRSTMDSIGSYRTALDGTEHTTTDTSFVSF